MMPCATIVTLNTILSILDSLFDAEPHINPYGWLASDDFKLIVILVEKVKIYVTYGSHMFLTH